jgi:Amt family ammonium transporter
MAEYPVAYNGTIATGGDSLTEDLNIYYSVCQPPYCSMLF